MYLHCSLGHRHLCKSDTSEEKSVGWNFCQKVHPTQEHFLSVVPHFGQFDHHLEGASCLMADLAEGYYGSSPAYHTVPNMQNLEES